MPAANTAAAATTTGNTGISTADTIAAGTAAATATAAAATANTAAATANTAAATANTAAGIIAALQARFPRVTPRASADHPAVNVPADDAVALLRCLRDEHGFDHLADLTAIDWAPGASPRFTVVWHLFSHTSHDYLRITADCAGDTAPEMPSMTGLWPAANWHEREAYDMFGITFTGHPDLRRILMWDGYAHHPLRKDFPLAGIETGLWDADVGSVVNTKVIAAPMAGGPFVAAPGGLNPGAAEPRAKDESWSEGSEKPKAEG